MERTVDLLLLVLLVLDRGEVYRRRVRKQHAARGEVLVAREQHRVQHGLVQEEIAHPLADDDVELLQRQLNLLKLALDERNDYVKHRVSDESSERATHRL